MLSDMNRCIGIGSIFLRFQSVIHCSQHNIVTDQRAVADGNSALILKMAAGVDEHIFADGDIFTKVRVEWRKQKTEKRTEFYARD